MKKISFGTKKIDTFKLLISKDVPSTNIFLFEEEENETFQKTEFNEKRKIYKTNINTSYSRHYFRRILKNLFKESF